MKGMQWVTGLLVLASVAGLAVMSMEVRKLQDRIVALERTKATRTPAAAPAKEPRSEVRPAVVLPSNDLSHLEGRIAILEARAGAAAPAAAGSSEGPVTAPTVSEDLRQAVLVVLQERDAEKAARDAETAKAWQSGVVDWQVDDLAARLQLSPTQKEQIQAIYKAGWEKLSKVWAGMFSADGAARGADADRVRVETEKLTAEVDSRAKALLSVEQAAKYDEWRKEQSRWWQGGRSGGR